VPRQDSGGSEDRLAGIAGSDGQRRVGGARAVYGAMSCSKCEGKEDWRAVVNKWTGENVRGLLGGCRLKASRKEMWGEIAERFRKYRSLLTLRQIGEELDEGYWGGNVRRKGPIEEGSNALARI